MTTCCSPKNAILALEHFLLRFYRDYEKKSYFCNFKYRCLCNGSNYSDHDSLY